MRCERGCHVTDLIDTTEMYLRTIFELEEEGIVAAARPDRRAPRPQRPDRLADRGPDGARRAAHRHRRPPPRAHRRRPGQGHPGDAQAPAGRAAADRRHRPGVGVRPRRGLPLGARDERAGRAQAPRAARPPHRVAVRQPDPGPGRARRHGAGEDFRAGCASSPTSPTRRAARSWCAGSASPPRATPRCCSLLDLPGCGRASRCRCAGRRPVHRSAARSRRRRASLPEASPSTSSPRSTDPPGGPLGARPSTVHRVGRRCVTVRPPQP